MLSRFSTAGPPADGRGGEENAQTRPLPSRGRRLTAVADSAALPYPRSRNVRRHAHSPVFHRNADRPTSSVPPDASLAPILDSRDQPSQPPMTRARRAPDPGRDGYRVRHIGFINGDEVLPPPRPKTMPSACLWPVRPPQSEVCEIVDIISANR